MSDGSAVNLLCDKSNRLHDSDKDIGRADGSALSPERALCCNRKVRKDEKSLSRFGSNIDAGTLLILFLETSKWVSECDKNMGKASKSPLLFAWVGGEKPADMTLRVKSPALNALADPFVLESTPGVLSIGRRCVDDGWSF